MVSKLTGVAALVALVISLIAPPAGAGTAVPNVGAPSAVLLDRRDGKVLWEKDSQTPRAIASTTKIVTALVVLDYGRLDELVVVSAGAEKVGSDDPLVTELELVSGERMSVRNLLYGLLLISANDAAVALAEHFAGSSGAFAERMNKFANANGAKSSHFVNPHGFDDPGHVSSALDLALLARKGLSDPLFAEIVATRSFEIRRDSGAVTKLENRNQLLGTFAGADGVKTGQTRAAGKALIASASRGSESRIAVVLGANDSFADAGNILEFGFTAFRRVDVTSKGITWGYLTYGDGTTYSLVPQSTLSMLVGLDSPTPQARYQRGVIVVSVPGEEIKAVNVNRVCTSVCMATTGIGWIGSAWEILGPLARIFASIFET